MYTQRIVVKNSFDTRLGVGNVDATAKKKKNSSEKCLFRVFGFHLKCTVFALYHGLYH